MYHIEFELVPYITTMIVTGFVRWFSDRKRELEASLQMKDRHLDMLPEQYKSDNSSNLGMHWSFCRFQKSWLSRRWR